MKSTGKRQRLSISNVNENDKSTIHFTGLSEIPYLTWRFNVEKKCKYSSPQTRRNEESLVYSLTIVKQKLVRDSQRREKFKGAHSKHKRFSFMPVKLVPLACLYLYF